RTARIAPGRLSVRGRPRAPDARFVSAARRCRAGAGAARSGCRRGCHGAERERKRLRNAAEVSCRDRRRRKALIHSGPMSSRGWVLFFALASLATAAQAQMYKCVDERGVTHYSDKPSPGCKGKEVDIQPIPPIGGQVEPRSRDAAREDADFQRR